MKFLSNVNLQHMKTIEKTFLPFVSPSSCSLNAMRTSEFLDEQFVRLSFATIIGDHHPRSALGPGASSFFNRKFDKAEDCLSSILSAEVASNNLRSLHRKGKWAWARAQASPLSQSRWRHGKNDFGMLSKSLAMHWGASSQNAELTDRFMRLDRVSRRSPASGCFWKSRKAIETIMREKCKVLALLAAPGWRRAARVQTLSGRNRSRKCSYNC